MKSLCFALVILAGTAFAESAPSVRESWTNADTRIEVMSDGTAEMNGSCGSTEISSWNEENKPMIGTSCPGPVCADPSRLIHTAIKAKRVGDKLVLKEGRTQITLSPAKPDDGPFIRCL